MSDAVPDVLDAPVLPEPEQDLREEKRDIPLETVEDLLREYWGLSGQVFPVEENDGLGYLVDNGHMRYLFEIRDPAEEAELRLQHDALRHITRSPDGPPVPEPVASKNGSEIVAVDMDGQACLLRVLTALDGAPAPFDHRLSDRSAAAFGTLIASLAVSLADFEIVATDESHDDDLRKAGPKTVSLLAEVTDQEARDQIARAMVAALRRIHALTPDFRLGLTLPDLDLDDLAGEGEGDRWRPTGISDLGPIGMNWHVATLAKACAQVLAGHDGDPAVILPVVAAYHAINPLNEKEAEALWPLVIAQVALAAAVAENAHARFPDDETAASKAAAGRRVLREAGSAGVLYMHASTLAACDLQMPSPHLSELLPEIDAQRIHLVDLGVASPLLYDGNWTDPDCDWKLLARVAWDTGLGSTRYGEYRLSRSRMDGEAEPDTFALHLDICLPATSPAVSPFAGIVGQNDGLLAIKGAEVTLLVEGLESELAVGDQVLEGADIGRVAGGDGAVGGLRIRLARDAEMPPPLFCTPLQAAIWRLLAPSPSAMLRLDCDAPNMAPGMANGRTVRAWREFLFDEKGGSRLDMSGSAPLVGHGHPDIAAAGYRQSLLIAMPHADQPAPTALEEDMLEIAPAGLDRVVLFEDAKAAIEAISATARQRTGRERIAHLERDGEASVSQTTESDVAAVIAEPFPFTRNLAERTTAARAEGSLVIIDERRTGHGRLVDHAWASEREALSPDALIAGSCDGGELTALYCRADLAEELAAHARPLPPVRVATARAALRCLRDGEFRQKAEAPAGLLAAGLKEIAEASDSKVGFDGSGLLFVMQLSDEAVIEPERLRGIGLDGAAGHGTWLISPPLCISEESVRRYLETLRLALGLPVA